MSRLLGYVGVGALAGIVGTHVSSCYLCYEYVHSQGYSAGSCAATSLVYTGFISQPLAVLGAAGGGLLGLVAGGVDVVVRKQRNLEGRL